MSQGKVTGTLQTLLWAELCPSAPETRWGPSPQPLRAQSHLEAGL